MSRSPELPSTTDPMKVRCADGEEDRSNQECQAMGRQTEQQTDFEADRASRFAGEGACSTRMVRSLRCREVPRFLPGLTRGDLPTMGRFSCQVSNLPSDEACSPTFPERCSGGTGGPSPPSEVRRSGEIRPSRLFLCQVDRRVLPALVPSGRHAGTFLCLVGIAKRRLGGSSAELTLPTTTAQHPFPNTVHWRRSPLSATHRLRRPSPAGRWRVQGRALVVRGLGLLG